MKKRNLVTMVVLLMCTFASLLCLGDANAGNVVHGTVAPGEVEKYSIALKDGDTTQIIVRGTGEGGDIDCFLLDFQERVVDVDEDSTNTCFLNVTPDGDELFEIRVVNNGRRTVYFAMTAL